MAERGTESLQRTRRKAKAQGKVGTRKELEREKYNQKQVLDW